MERKTKGLLGWLVALGGAYAAFNAKDETGTLLGLAVMGAGAYTLSQTREGDMPGTLDSPAQDNCPPGGHC